jgi:hypothetical protein
MATVRPFRIEIGDDIIEDLRDRIARTRWPDEAPGPQWSQGTDLEYLRDFLQYWAEEFDWTSQERALNSLEHFTTDVDGTRVHFIHERAASGDGVPLLLMHGWPSCFVEYVPAIPLLTDPTSHGIDYAPTQPKRPAQNDATRNTLDAAAVAQYPAIGLGFVTSAEVPILSGWDVGSFWSEIG